MDTLSIRN